MTFRNGLKSLLRPKDLVLVLIDHHPYQLVNLNSHEPQMVVNNATALAKAEGLRARSLHPAHGRGRCQHDDVAGIGG
jgi:hypothetical protein